MKYTQLIFTLLLQFIITITFAQGNKIVEDGLTIRKLEYKLIDSTAFQSLQGIVKHSPTVVSYYSSDGVRVAYKTTNGQQWISVLVRFNNILDVKSINMDHNHHPELVITGNTSSFDSGGGTKTFGASIISTEKSPSQVFDIDFGCREESFGDKSKDGKGRSFRSYKRNFKIIPGGIKIGKIKESALEIGCNLTEIPAGVYILNEGTFKRR